MSTYGRTIPLSETTKFIVDNRGKTSPTADTGIALIATNCITNDHLYPQYINVRRVSQETYDAWFRAHPEPGDIILTNKGSKNGAICLVPDPVDFVIAQDMVALRANEEVIDPLFLFAALRSPIAQSQIRNLDVSGVIPHFKKTDFDKLQLPYPDRKTQEAIGRIYFDFCAKIELNRQMNETLEATARALFKSWFVDFDPVRAKMDGQKPFGMDEHTAKLFPASFSETEVGKIPHGWAVKPVGDVVKAVGGGTPNTKEPAYWEGGTNHWVTPKDLSRLDSPVLLASERKVTDAGLAKTSSGLLPVGTLLLSSRAPVGYLAISQVPVAVNQGFLAMVCKDEASNYYMLNWAKENMDQIESRASGTTFQEISKRSFRPIPIVVPTLKLMSRFSELVASFYEGITSNLREASVLSRLRDTLLPKLLSGELRVADAEKPAEEAA